MSKNRDLVLDSHHHLIVLFLMHGSKNQLKHFFALFHITAIINIVEAMGEVAALYDNPVKQAEYLYSLIESESK